MTATLFFCVCVTLILQASDASLLSPIKHIVVLMMENRSFDHMLGWMKRGGSQGDTRVDGLDGSECNPRDLSDPSKGEVCVNDLAKESCPYDPNHGHEATTERIFACQYDSSATGGDNPCTNHGMTDGNASMQGFVQSAVWEGKDGVNEMTMWPSEKVPIITTLAKEFANFDRFFCSHPGPTYPNRQFVHSGAAHGETNDEVPKDGFPQKTIFRVMEENSKSWKMYYEDAMTWAIFMGDLRRDASKPFIQHMDEFYADAKAGTLPDYSFIEPRISSSPNGSLPSFGLANHQHPTASVREGERLMKNVYEALRNGPNWESTMLVLTYDEHGGFYDHVSPPQTNVPNPDGINAAKGFEYTRLGIRIPTIVISPWVEKGTLIHAPSAAQRQAPDSEFELSSIAASIRKMWNLEGGPLTNRTAWAATFDDVLTRTTPRTDCPRTLPELPPPDMEMVHIFQALPLDDHARRVVDTFCQLNHPSDERCTDLVQYNSQLPAFLKIEFETWLQSGQKGLHA